MKNSKLRRILMLLACAVLLVCLSVGATLAYLTSTTEIVENTFTVGKVVIDIDEARVNEYGDPVKEVITKDEDDKEIVTYEKVPLAEADRVMENDYKLLPGHEYTKDPVIYVEDGSEQALVYVVIDNPLKPIIGWTNKADDVIGLQLTYVDGEANGPWMWVDENGDMTLYAYKTVVDAREGEVKLDTFKYIDIREDVDYTALESYAGKQIDVKAYAIQADGMIAGEAPTWEELVAIWNANFKWPGEE